MFFFSTIKNFFKKYKLISILSLVLILILVIILIYFTKNKNSKSDNLDIPSTSFNDYIPSEPESKPVKNFEALKIGKEFDILTKVGDLKSILVTQKVKEETKLNSEIIKSDIIRKTNYNIYFKSEEKSSEEDKKYYNKMNTGIVSIQSECTAIDEDDCGPQTIIDLISESKNLRLLNSEELEDIPIPLCIFNITDNNIITTMKCSKHLSENKRNEIILDLYFFRPPAAERIDKEGDNITISKNITENFTIISETNGGVCNIYNNLGSLCTTNMKTILDKEGNLLSYDERAFTLINYDENNSYIKDKITNLIDISENIKKNDIQNYEKSLNNLLKIIDPYMKEETQFNKSEFEDLYKVTISKKNKNSTSNENYEPKKSRNTFRNLKTSATIDNAYSQYMSQAELFLNKITPVQINLNLKINPGINSNFIGAYGNIIFDDKEILYSSFEEVSALQNLIEKLSALSKAGNALATELYDKIYNKLETFTNEISIRIKSLDELLMYYDIYQVFNSTLVEYSYKTLPSETVEISDELIKSLNNTFYNIKKGNIKLNVDNLSDDINNYINEIYELIKKMMDNLEDLSNILITKNNTFAQITNYYLNDTSFSFSNIIEKIKAILNTYFIKEFENVNPKIEEILYLLELNSNNKLKIELNRLKDLYNNIKNNIYKIKLITESDYQKLLSNLDKSFQYPSDIINGIKNYIEANMNIKENGHFLSNEEISNFNDSVFNIIIESEKIVKILDDIEIIDKYFDKIMIKFRENMINSVKNMEKIKSENFILEEDILNKTLFSEEEKDKIESELKNLSDNLINVIQTEKNTYMQKIENNLEIFFDNNQDNLNDIISDLDAYLSEDNLNNMAQAFESSLNLTLELLTNKVQENINLTKQYFDLYFDMINDDSGLKNLLQNYYLNDHTIYTPYYSQSVVHQIPIFDKIYGKMRTNAYSSKYNTYIANFDFAEAYLKEQMKIEISNKYRETFPKIKEELKLIIDNRLSEKYKNYSDFYFLENNLRIINRLNERIDKYFSSEIFDKKYLKIINENINSNIELIKSTKAYIIEKHNHIKDLGIYADNSNDICIVFRRKVCYGCTNCVSYTYFYDRFCFILSPYENNYISIKKISFDLINNFTEYNSIFNNININIKEKIEIYNDILKDLDLNISKIINEMLNKDIDINDNIKEINDWILLILQKKFEKVLLNKSYDYYKTNLDLKLENIFSEIFQKWKSIYKTLSKDVLNNIYNIKDSILEFSNMAEIYRTIIKTDLAENYFNSIIFLEQSELNYQISFYYNYLIKLLDKYFKYINNKIEKNSFNLNNILSNKKFQIKNNFDNFTQNIIESEHFILNTENQSPFLQTNESDFFQVKHILQNNIQNTSDTLEEKVEEILFNELFLSDGDEYSLVMRYYLENKELGKFIEELYKPLDNDEYIYLNLDKFKDILNENWLFDTEDFINMINKALYETNKEINDDLNIKLLEYAEKIDNELNTKFFFKIENIIIHIFKNLNKYVQPYQKNNINNNISELINQLESEIKSEANIIQNNPGEYKLNIENIKNLVINYKEDINKRINNTIFEELNIIYNNIIKNIYQDLTEQKANYYLNHAKKIISEFDLGEYQLLNLTFDLKKIIYNLVESSIDFNKKVIKKKIYNKYIQYYKLIITKIDIESIFNIVSNNLDNIYETELLPKLNAENNCSLNDCPIFDFSQETKENINIIISKKMNSLQQEISLIINNRPDINRETEIEYPNSLLENLGEIYESLESFLSFENETQVLKINEHIQNSIKSNLDGFLNNVVPLYGNAFFERIIDYNINFKIISLYEYLHYGISKTLLYYHSLRVLKRDIKDLPSDLKIRLYNLNDLDLTVINKNKEIKILLEKKLTELINNLKHEAKNAYNRFIKEDTIIKNSFGSNILKNINLNLDNIMDEIENKYQISLEKFLKEKFLDSFSEVLDQELNNMLKIFYEEKNKLKERLDDLFSSKEEKSLNEINNNINKTLESIQLYNDYLSNFKISENVNKFFISYSEINLLPIFQKFNLDLNKKMKEIIIKEIKSNSLEIENLTPSIFENKAKEIHAYLFNDYINYITDRIKEYGNTELNYKNNLEKNVEKNGNILRRRLIENNLEEEMAEEAKKRIESKDVEESLELLVNKTRNIKIYIDTLYFFTEKRNIFKNFKNQINIDFKNINQKIILNEYNDEINSFLTEKLLNLTNKLNNYYDSINIIFLNFQKEISDSINEINYSMNNIMEITKNILNEKYKDISKLTERINKTKKNSIEEFSEDIKYTQKSENMLTTGIAYINNINEYAEFYMDLILEGNKFIKPKIKAKIVDKTIPKDVKIIISSDYGFCYSKLYLFEIEFNEANYTSTIEFDTKTNYLNITTYIDIDKYQYNITKSEQKGDMVTEEISVVNYIRRLKCINNKRNISKELLMEVPAKKYNLSEIINSIFIYSNSNQCEEGYIFDGSNCTKKCEIGENEKCKKCDLLYPQYCGSCNENYFLNNLKGSQCQKCEINNCLECIGNSTYNKCIKCEENYILSGGLCLNYCEIGKFDKCVKCNDEPGKIDQCEICNDGYYLPENEEYNKTQCEQCQIKGCNICSGNLINNTCVKCENNLTAVYEDGKIVSCEEKIASTPDRIDIIKNGKLNDSIIEIKGDHVTKTQLDNAIRYYTYASSCIAYATSYWAKPFQGNPECQLPIYFNITKALPKGINYLIGDYTLYLKASERFTATSDSPYGEFFVEPPFWMSWGDCSFGSNWNGCYPTNTFGIYKNLERVNHNGQIFIGGVYNRGLDYYQLEGFNYTTNIGNGTQVIGWKFYISAGDFGQVRSNSLSIAFTVNDLYLIKKKKDS